MSWKATAWVKELGEGITRSEKFVLLMLAEYHNTKLKAAWPSVEGLAEDCMMSKRQVQRILKQLEQSGWIVRTLRCELGRGQITEYLIPQLDGKVDKMSPIKGDIKGDISDIAIRKNRLLEPVIYTPAEKPAEMPQRLLERNERERKQRLTEATKRGLRDYSKHPLESWETESA